MGVRERVSQWRNAMRTAHGGSTQPGVWVPTRYADFLKEVIGRLSQLGTMGDEYRSIAYLWLNRRRPVAHHYTGFGYSLEIDGPSVGAYWYNLPMGGRVMGEMGTWVELTPDEAEEVHSKVRRAVGSTLEEWLREKELLGHIVDHTGVATDVAWSDPRYPESQYTSIARPATDDDFQANEVRIARDVERDAYRRRRHPTDDPTIEYYEGFHGYPSRCHIIHRQINGNVLFALGHVKNGGTSPTNMFENLATLLRRKYYPKIAPGQIRWFDVWIDVPYDGQKRINSVELTWNGSRYENPAWDDAPPPEDFVAEIDRVYQQANEYELDAFMAQHPDYIFRLPSAYRETCGTFQKDIEHKDPGFKFVAHLHAYPGDAPSAGAPCLIISDASDPTKPPVFSAHEKINEAAAFMPVLAKYLKLPGETGYGWNDPTFREICADLDFDVEAAREKLAPALRSDAN